MLSSTLILTLSSALAASAIPTSHTSSVTQESTSRVLFISSEKASTQQLPACLSKGYYGSYGSVRDSEQIYIADSDCLSSVQSFTSGSIAEIHGGQHAEGRTLVWIGESGVDNGVFSVSADESPITGVWEHIEESYVQGFSSLTADDSEQHVLGGSHHSASPLLVQRTRSSLILSIPNTLLPQIDLLLPPHFSAVALPSSPYPIHSSTSAYPPVKQDLIDNIVNITKKLKFDPVLDSILNDGLDEHLLVRDVRWLTGESSDIVSRHSFTTGCIQAAKWIKTKVQATGADCQLVPFKPGFAPNVICTYPSLDNSTDLVILSAHYDSRGSFGQLRAPGGDDDGSGSGHLLGVANAIYTQNITFHKSVVLAFFAGEEQGLVGSAAYARELYEANATVLMQTQADMLGYHSPMETLQLGLPATIGTVEAADLLRKLAKIYAPELVLGITSACCSDHQSFVGYGFPATQVFERNGWIADPMYHNSGDLSLREGYDFDQILSIAKVTFAGVLSVAGYEVGIAV